MTTLPPVSTTDLQHILAHSESDFADLRGARLFITGGTGFFGTWLLEAIVAANRQLNADIETWVLSRDPAAFARRSPHLANASGIHWLTGEVANFAFPAGSFSHIIHAATAASAALNSNAPEIMLDTIVQGTRHTLKFAAASGARRMLLTSSGGIYGRQPQDLHGLPETFAGAPDCLTADSAYSEGKRIAELLSAIAARNQPTEIAIARCFAFIGPHLPLDTHFAAGNFLRDALLGETIVVSGNGQPIRSYLYAADLVIWLLRILGRGQALRPYNVGSEEAVSIAGLASAIADSAHLAEVAIQQPPAPHDVPRYLPDTRRAREELGLQTWIPLAESISRTLTWLRQAWPSARPAQA